eukprot:352225-Chlamydomonas_euryale.AAC.1
MRHPTTRRPTSSARGSHAQPNTLERWISDFMFPPWETFSTFRCCQGALVGHPTEADAENVLPSNRPDLDLPAFGAA